MPGHAQPKRTQPNREQRKLRMQQIVFAILAGVLIFSWIASLLIRP